MAKFTDAFFNNFSYAIWFYNMVFSLTEHFLHEIVKHYVLEPMYWLWRTSVPVTEVTRHLIGEYDEGWQGKFQTWKRVYTIFYKPFDTIVVLLFGCVSEQWEQRIEYFPQTMKTIKLRSTVTFEPQANLCFLLYNILKF